MPKKWGNKFSATGVSPKWVKSRRRRKRRRKKIGENNDQLCFVLHHASTPGPKMQKILYLIYDTSHKTILHTLHSAISRYDVGLLE